MSRQAGHLNLSNRRRVRAVSVMVVSMETLNSCSKRAASKTLVKKTRRICLRKASFINVLPVS